MKAVARCTGELLTSLRIAGLQSDKVTCVGHSLGKKIFKLFLYINGCVLKERRHKFKISII